MLTNIHYYDIITTDYKMLEGDSVEITTVLKQLVSITQFNKGKAAQLFSRVKTKEPLVVLKNNTPVAIVISPEDYKIIENYINDKKDG